MKDDDRETHAERAAARILALWAQGPLTVGLIGSGAAREAVLNLLAVRLAGTGQLPRFMRTARDGRLPEGPAVLLIEDADTASDTALQAIFARPDLFAVLGGTATLQARLRARPEPPVLVPAPGDGRPTAGMRRVRVGPVLIWATVILTATAALAFQVSALWDTLYPPRPPPRIAKPVRPPPPPAAPPPDATAQDAAKPAPPPEPPAPAPAPARTLRVRVTYSGSDPYAAALARGIVPLLRSKGFTATDAEPGPAANATFVLRIFFTTDRPEADALRAILDSLLPSAVVVEQVRPLRGTRPGDAVLAFSGEKAAAPPPARRR